MSDFNQRVLKLFESLHPLDRIARAGFVIRGVAEPESIAAHSHFMAILALLVADEYPDVFDKEKALTMTLLHDISESVMMDIPLPASDRFFKAAKDAAEMHITQDLLEGLPARYIEYHREFLEASSPEGKLVRALDKIQMLIKVGMYQREGRGRLDDFWSYPGNFNDYGLKPISDLFDALCQEFGKSRPKE